MSRSALLWFLTAAALFGADRYRASEPHMGTLVSITLYTDTPERAQQAFAAAFARIEELNKIFSDYDPASELSNVCTSEQAPGRDLLTVLRYAQAVAEETDGAFDITLGPLTKLWRSARSENRLPAESAIAAALAHSGHRHLQVSEDRIRCALPGMHLDAGGIAKGYAADEALATLRRAGVTRALVAMSGDIACGDSPLGEPGWKVEAAGQVHVLHNKAVSTSGDEFQSLKSGGVRYSHILDPRTGMALRNSRTVSVIANTGMEADALATAISVAGPGAAKSRQVQVFIP